MTIRVIHTGDAPKVQQGPLNVSKLLSDSPLLSISRLVLTGENRQVRNPLSDSAYYVLAGTGDFFIDGARHEVKAGDLVYIPRGTSYWDRGELELLAINSPPLDLNSIEYL